jgi:hypothetical protein
MVQESTLHKFVEQSDGLARGSGFAARFLIARPRSTIGTRFYKPPKPCMPALKAFISRLGQILALGVPIDDDGVLHPKEMELSPEAKAAWIEYHDHVEGMLCQGGELYDVEDVASKSADCRHQGASRAWPRPRGQDRVKTRNSRQPACAGRRCTMSLQALAAKLRAGRLATAASATLATETGSKADSVAEVAAVAVAIPPTRNISSLSSTGTQAETAETLAAASNPDGEPLKETPVAQASALVDHAIVLDQACPNSTLKTKSTSGQQGSTHIEYSSKNRNLYGLASPPIDLTLRPLPLSRRGYRYGVALEGEVIVSSSRDP